LFFSRAKQKKSAGGTAGDMTGEKSGDENDNGEGSDGGG